MFDENLLFLYQSAAIALFSSLQPDYASCHDSREGSRRLEAGKNFL